MRILISSTLIGLLVGACASVSHLTVDLGEATELAGPEFQWPVDGAVVTQRFRPDRERRRRRHQGIDLAAERNAPIYAVDHGRVIYAGHGYSGYGRLIIIDHPNGPFQTYYAHLSRYKVEKGDVVKKGDLIGLMGNSGRSTGVHLHFELRQGDLALNPLDYLPQTTMTAQPAAP